MNDIKKEIAKILKTSNTYAIGFQDVESQQTTMFFNGKVSDVLSAVMTMAQRLFLVEPDAKKAFMEYFDDKKKTVAKRKTTTRKK